MSHRFGLRFQIINRQTLDEVRRSTELAHVDLWETAIAHELAAAWSKASGLGTASLATQGEATRYSKNSTFGYETDIEIANGTSGGPIVNHEGELVGVVSHGTNSPSDGKYSASAGLLPLALPAWIIARINRGRPGLDLAPKV